MSLPRSFRPLALVVSFLVTVASLAVLAVTGAPARAAVTVAASGATSTGTSTTTTLSIDRPASAAPGQLLLAQVATDRGLASIGAPAGWTLLVDSRGGSNLQQAVFWRVMGPGDPATYQWTLSAAGSAVGGITAYGGVDPVNPVEAFDTGTGNGGTPSVPGLTATAGSRLVALFSAANSNSLTAPTSLAQRYAAGGTATRVRAADAVVTDTGSTGQVGATLSPSNGNRPWVGHLLSLREPAQNVAPTVSSIAGSSSADEGAVGSYSIAATDADGDSLSYAWSIVSGPASLQGAAGGSSVSVAFGDGPGTVRLRVSVGDGKGHSVQRDLDVSVANVAPTATFAASSPVTEGAPIQLSFADPADEVSADETAGFTYAFDCGDGFGDYASSTTGSCPTDDEGLATVSGRVKDKDGGLSQYTATVQVTGVAPTATFAADPSTGEGSPFTLALTDVADPSAADTAAGFTYSFDCGDGTGFTIADGPGLTCPTDDDGARAVGARVTDKDGATSAYSTTVGVDNLDPTAVLSTNSPLDEGSDIALSLDDADDPSAVDAAQLTYGFDCDTTDADGPVSTGTLPTTTCATADDGTRSVAGRVSDKDGGATTYDADVIVRNVAPTATFSPAGVDEGSSIVLTLDDVVDPGSDTFEFRFDCGDGVFGAWGPNAAACPTDDDGTREVRAQVRDDEGDANEYSATVSVAVVNPNATLVVTPEGEVDEGDSFTLSLTDAVDPSPVDLAALTYQFDCGDAAGWQDASDLNSVTCSTSDDGPRHVRARVIAPGGESTEHSYDVTVVNLAPVPSLTAPSAVEEGSPIELSATATDVSSADEAEGFSWAFDCGDGEGYGAFTSADTASCPTSDDGVRTVRVQARDKDGGIGTAADMVTVSNVAPTATLSAPDVREGEDITVSLGDVVDPSTADTGAGFAFAFRCGDVEVDAFADADFGSASSATCPTDDDGEVVASAAVRDKDGGATIYSRQVTVAPVAPSGTFSAGDVDEGSPILLTVTDVTDPSAQDTQAGFEYAFDCGTGSGYGAWGPSATASCPTLDQGGRTVGARIRDKDDAQAEQTLPVTVRSVAPTGTFSVPSTVSEADDVELRISDVTDPSPADAGAGFSYAFDCGAGYGSFGSAPARTCGTDDDGTLAVAGQVRDKDLHASEYTGAVTVVNVAPSGTLEVPATVDEGSPFTLALTGVTDPSDADTAAGFTYKFDCGAGYGAYGSESTRSCPTTDDDVRSVRATVRDKDGGERELTASTTVLNVAPVVTAPTGRSTLPGVATAFSLGSFSDAGVDDAVWTVDVSWGDGTTSTYATSTQGAIPSASHTYALAGSRTVVVRVTDKDGGASQAAFAVEVDLTDKVVLGQDEVGVAGARSAIVGNVHGNRALSISGAGGEVCGDLTAGLAVSSMSVQTCGVKTSGAAPVVVPSMTGYVPTAYTHTLTGDRVLNGYTCTLATGCVVKVTGRLELRGVVSGKVWFVADGDVKVTGDLAPANSSSSLRVHSRQAIDVAAAKASITGQLLAGTVLKLSGSSQILTGLFWGRASVELSGSNGSLRGAVVSNGTVKLAGSSRTLAYDASVIKL